MILNAIYARLSGNSDLTDIVSDRIYAINIPEGDVAPAVAYNAISNPSQTQSGYAYSTDSVEIIAISKTYDEGASIAELIAKMFYTYRYNVGTVRVMGSKVDSITRSYSDYYKEYQFTLNITLNSKIT